MAKGLTRREFLKLSGQAVAATSAACAVSGLAPQLARAETPVEVDGREIVARVGDTFATIQLVPRYSKSRQPSLIYGKVQYGTDPSFGEFTESGEVTAQYYPRVEGGRHRGTEGNVLVASRKTHFISGRWEITPGDLIRNKTDGSVMVVSAVLNDRRVEGTLSGGVKNVWSTGDRWRLYRTYYRLEVELRGLQPNTKYYYRLLLRHEGDSWPAPRASHSFRTRRPTGETFRFAIWADTHRDVREKCLAKQLWRWPEWSALVTSLKNEQADFVIDLGDSWLMCSGSGKPRTLDFPEAYTRIVPGRSGYLTYQGYSDLCADCGYYLVRGNHDGLANSDSLKARKLYAALLKLLVPNPTGTTYPQGGSVDGDYDQGYFAFEWGDALFVVMDVVKYKEKRRQNRSPARFHIGEAQLAWLTTVLQDSTQKWKFLFMHHLFGGADSYGRGGAAYAFGHEQAQIQALAEQYGAHIFKGHDHLLAAEWANNVLYYTCGLAWGAQTDYLTKSGISYGDFYPGGFTPTSCKSYPPACENNGYVVVEVSPAQVRIQYKGYLGNVLNETVLT